MPMPPNHIQTWDCGTDRIDLTHLKPAMVTAAKFTELHHKSDGSTVDAPSFCFVLSCRPGFIIAEIALAELVDTFDELGYELKRKES